VFLERRGDTLNDEAARTSYRDDFGRLLAEVDEAFAAESAA